MIHLYYQIMDLSSRLRGSSVSELLEDHPEAISDYILIIIDAETKIKTTINRDQLLSIGGYFTGLLNNFKEKNQKEIILEVPNAIACYDLIKKSKIKSIIW